MKLSEWHMHSCILGLTNLKCSRYFPICDGDRVQTHLGLGRIGPNNRAPNRVRERYGWSLAWMTREHGDWRWWYS